LKPSKTESAPFFRQTITGTSANTPRVRAVSSQIRLQIENDALHHPVQSEILNPFNTANGSQRPFIRLILCKTKQALGNISS
tara:strand:+ start:91670 stop:91915 length:246 start_codon:yes stop_codon:yes gene_type:complete